MSATTDLRRMLNELHALDVLRGTKQRQAGRTLAKLKQLHPDDWRQRARIDEQTARELLRAAGHGERR